MQKNVFLMSSLLAVIALLSVACSSTYAAASQTVVSTPPPMATPSPVVALASSPAPKGAPGVEADTAIVNYESQVVEGGSVTVAVTPLRLKAGAPSRFEIAMNTHSVDLSADMLQAVVLRDDTGKEYAPTQWDGPDGAGHHRSGNIDFVALSPDAKSVTLIVKGIGKVAERTYKWDVQP